MAIPTTRRLALALPFLAFPVSSISATGDVQTELQELEARSGGRLGVAVLDTATGLLIGNRINERFAMCSTCKALAVAFVLSRVDRNAERLDRRVTFTEHDLVLPFKATKPHVGPEGMTIAELCEAAITVSDSTAVNLLFASFGGPAALTAYLRSLVSGTARPRVSPVDIFAGRVDHVFGNWRRCAGKAGRRWGSKTSSASASGRWRRCISGRPAPESVRLRALRPSA